MTDKHAKLIILGDEKETKKSHIVTKFVISNGGRYENKPTIIQSINIQTNNNNNESLTFEISPINISPTYNLTKNYKSTHDKKLKTLYANSDIIFIAYNVCNSKSFQNAIKYYEQYEENKNNMLNANIIIVLIGHKFGSYTSFKRDVKIENGQKCASKHNSFFFEVSTNDNSIDSLFQNIGKLYLDKINENNINIINKNISPKISKLLSITDRFNDKNTNEYKNDNQEFKQHEYAPDIFNDSNPDLVSKLNEKILDYESIVYSLEHTLSLHEKDKKHLFDKSMEYESESIQFKLEIESKNRQIERQNDEINKLINDLRNKTNTIEELKNKNMSFKRSKPKPPPRKGSSNVSDISNNDNDANEPYLINERPIHTRSRSHTVKDVHVKDKNNNVFSGITNAFKKNIFSPSKINENDEKHKEIEIELRKKCDKLQTMTDILKKVNEEKCDEIEILKQNNINIMKQLDIKQKNINHLRECLEDNQIGFTNYKEDTEQKLNKWKTEKKYWFDKYKNINTQNQKLIEQKRKLERENRKLQKSKNKWKERALAGSYIPKDKINDKDMGDDIIHMDKITIDSLKNKTISKQFDDTLWNIPQLLRDFKTLKTNYYNNLVEKIMELEDENENEMDIIDDEIVINVLFYSLIECHLLIEKINDSISIEIIFDRMNKNKNIIFEKMENNSIFNEKFQIWFDDKEGSELENDFKQYIEICLEYCILIKYFKLELFPKDNKLEFNIVNGILNYCDIMEREDTFDGTLNDNKWYCSFPSIIKNENNLNEKEILEIINCKNKDKYNIFKSKMWMYQSKN